MADPIKTILFIQPIPDIRTNKIAKTLRDKEIQTDILYLKMHPKDVYQGLSLPYHHIFKLRTIKEIVDFVEQSDYDLIFSCNEPDTISAALASANKPVIHDCHDMMSLRGDISNDQAILEFIANKYATGNIYVTELVKEIAIEKFGIGNKNIFVFDNYVLNEQLPDQFLPKLSASDGEIHCVYEGGLSNSASHHRFIEPVFLALAKEGIHVHFYTPFQSRYYGLIAEHSRYLHWEGTKEPNDLITEMTRYDAGLAILNVTDRNKAFLDSTFPNKAWDYLAAGLPTLFSDLTAFNHFLQHHHVGGILDVSGDIQEQVLRTISKPVSSHYIKEHGLTMDDQSEKLMNYMRETISSF